MRARLWGLVLFVGATAAQPSPAEAPLPDGLPVFRHWVSPVIPPGRSLPQGGAPLTALVEVGTDGQVVQARLKEKAAAEIETAFATAAKQWLLTPAVIDGAPYTVVLEVPVTFIRSPGAPGGHVPDAWELHPLHIEKPEVIRDVDASYPDELSARKIPGEVQFSCQVDDAGHPSGWVVTYATHAAFVEPALAAVKQWKIAPAVAGPYKVPCTLRGEVQFSSTAASNAEILAANAITGPDGRPPDAVPVVDAAPEPVYPYDRLLAGESGQAVATCTVLGTGNIDQLELKSATQPDFGAALLAAIQTWRFLPATSGGHGVDVPLMVTWSFLAPVGDNVDKLDPDFVSAVATVRSNGVAPANHLTSPLRPIFRQPPRYPGSLEGADRTPGAATVEVIITPDGRMRLPRIISATKPEFGWAAATAVNQWCFTPPMRDGKPATLRIQVPFKFSPQ